MRVSIALVVCCSACARTGVSPHVVEVAGYSASRLCVVPEAAAFRQGDFSDNTFCYRVDGTFPADLKRGDCIEGWFPTPKRMPDTKASQMKRLDRSCDIDPTEFDRLAKALLKT